MKIYKITIGLALIILVLTFTSKGQKTILYNNSPIYAPIDSILEFIFDNSIDSNIMILERTHVNKLFRMSGQDTSSGFQKIDSKSFRQISFDTFDLKHIDTLIKLLDDTLSCPYTFNTYYSFLCYDSLSSSIQIETACLIKGLQMKKYPFYFCSKDAIDSISPNRKAFIKESTKQDLIKWLKSR